jgi:Cytochrome c3
MLLLKWLAAAWAALFFLVAAPVQAQSTIESLVMPGKVIQGHAKVEGECKKCHEPFDKTAQSTLCTECHKDVADDISKRLGYHGRITQKPCKECHTDHKGRDAKIVVLKEASFDHRLTDYLLRGKHADVRCASCHVAGKKYREASSKCADCHGKDDVHKGALGKVCANCHVEKSWKEIDFDHEETKFPLLGKHATTECRACHKNDKYKETPMECVACHKKDDKHKGSLGPKCGDCHNERTWVAGRFDHDKETQFPLKGKHATVKCASCHKGLVFKEKLLMTCIACHKKEDKHKERYGEKCESCHNEKSWKEITFDHSKDTKFALLGKHAKVKCDDCHKGFLYKDKVGNTCLACHKKDDKHEGKFGDKCESCHGESDWKTIKFSHDRDTKYPLKGKHAQVKCVSCHKGHLYNDKLQTMCISCHEKDDKHFGQEGKNCERCHTEKTWKVESFDHSKSKFPLLGRHIAVECKECHKSLKFKDAPSSCNGCHAKDDTHKGSLGPKCDTCHNARDWELWDFNHNKQTKFVLDGAHKKKKVTCASCHKSAAAPAPKIDATCVSCHRDEDVHDGTFGGRCERCHTTVNWKQLIKGVTN